MGGLGDKLEGKADELSGKVKEDVGDATDNPRLQAEGVGDQAEGKVEQAIGEAKEACGRRDGGTTAPGPVQGRRNCARQRRESGGVRSSSIRSAARPSPAKESTSARVSGQGGPASPCWSSAAARTSRVPPGATKSRTRLITVGRRVTGSACTV